LFYFQTLVFKKSGNYLVAFHIEGTEFTDVKPLYFPIEVKPKHVKFGAEYALYQLRACRFTNNNGRQIQSGKRSYFDMPDARNECEAAKQAILTVYYALPVGSLIMGPELKPHENMFDCISEAVGWNDILDQLWRNLVIQADKASMLMEAILLLEFYINKGWISGASQKLLNILPSAHFAIRCSTYSSVALRLFSLDQCLVYDKIQYLPRSERSNTNTHEIKKIDVARPTTNNYSEILPAKRPRGNVKKRVIDSDDDEEVDETVESSEETGDDFSDSDESDGYKKRRNSNKAKHSASRISRPQRSAAAVASEKLRKNAESSDDEVADIDLEDNPNWAENYNKSSIVQPLTSWSCSACSFLNEARARSCSVCLTKKIANL